MVPIKVPKRRPADMVNGIAGMARIWNKKNESNSEQEEEEKELNPEISTEYFQSCINSHK